MAFGEFWESIKSTLEARAKSSFVGSFILAWCVFNWKGLYVTFVLSTAELPYQLPETRYPDKLSYLAELPGGWWQLLIGPLAVAATTPLAILVADELVGLFKGLIGQVFLWLNSHLLGRAVIEPKMYQRLQSQTIELRKKTEALDQEWLKARQERDEALGRLNGALSQAAGLEVQNAALQEQVNSLQEQVVRLEQRLAKPVAPGEERRRITELESQIAILAQALSHTAEALRAVRLRPGNLDPNAVAKAAEGLEERILETLARIDARRLDFRGWEPSAHS